LLAEQNRINALAPPVAGAVLDLDSEFADDIPLVASDMRGESSG
jgi:hypothetical protein